MAGNTFGKRFQLTTYGESHGSKIGGILDGVPSGLKIDFDAIQAEMDRRKPGQSAITTQRKEADSVEWHSGIFEGKTTGTPIAFSIENKDYRSRDYDHIKNTYRPSHADYVYDAKYGNRDYRGGGRSSARETACRVAAGALAKQFLVKNGITINGYVSKVGTVNCDVPYSELDFSKTEDSIVRCPHSKSADRMIEVIEAVKKQGDTLGGVVTGVIQGVPSGLGEPVFDKLHALLGQAMLSINAVKGFEYGSGFAGTELKGSQHNDSFVKEGGKTSTTSNHSGGIQGGISNGQDIYFNVAFKPVATIMKDQDSIDNRGETAIVKGKGRHDPCVVPRAVPIVEAMAALVIADFLLLRKTDQI